MLSQRALNRATLARQLLLHRHELSALATVEHLAGMQGQAPNAPYVGLWTRLVNFAHAELAGLLTDRQVVRARLMRATVHLVSAQDCLVFRPLVQPVLTRAFTGSPFGQHLRDTNLAAIAAAGRALLTEQPLTSGELGRLLAQQWPGADPVALAHVIGYLVPTVQIPPRAVWGSTGPARFTPLDIWLDRPLAADPSPETLVLRYLAAFGPASVADIRTWSGRAGLNAAVETLRPRLRTFTDEAGRELFDLPDAPLPAEDTPAPARFLPEYDNLLLSFADRTRVITDGRRVPLPPGNGATAGTILLDGFWRGTWKIQRSADTATLLIEPFNRLSTADRAELEREGHDLLAFAAPEADQHRVQV